MKKIAVVCIGNELLQGKTINTNLAVISANLFKIGYFVKESVCIQDKDIAIKKSLSYYYPDYDVIIITGGLGPTDDDITRKSVANFFAKKLILNEKAWEGIKAKFFMRNIFDIPKSNLIQAKLPEGFTFLKNDFGTAYGLYFKDKQKMFFMLPGVPYEMENVLINEVLPKLKKREYFSKTLKVCGIGESALYEKIKTLDKGKKVNLAYLPKQGKVDLHVYGENVNECEIFIEKIKKTIGENLSENELSSPQVLQNICIKNNLTVFLAESCTGGLLSLILTKNSGSSKYFLGAIVAYDNFIKEKLLFVKRDTLEKFGAVSKECVIEMAMGCQKVSKASLVASVSGIAGPDGALTDKPVGYVCFAVIFQNKVYTKEQNFFGDRKMIRQKAAEYLLTFIFNILEKNELYDLRGIDG